MEDLSLSVLLSLNKYLFNLQYLAKEDLKLADDLMLLIVANQVYNWASWMGASQQELLTLQNIRKTIIRNNSDIVNYITPTNQYYKNVNTPQTIDTWQRVYDNSEVITFETL